MNSDSVYRNMHADVEIRFMNRPWLKEGQQSDTEKFFSIMGRSYYRSHLSEGEKGGVSYRDPSHVDIRRLPTSYHEGWFVSEYLSKFAELEQSLYHINQVRVFFHEGKRTPGAEGIAVWSDSRGDLWVGLVKYGVTPENLPSYHVEEILDGDVLVYSGRQRVADVVARHKG